MRILTISLIAVSILNCPQPVFSSENPYVARPGCQKENANDPKLFSSDFHWGMSLDELVENFQKFYSSPKRLAKRGYWNPQQKSLILPFDSNRGGDVKITPRFARQIAQHIEAAYEKTYIDGVFFPDMGHSHLLIPQRIWDGYYSKFEVKDFARQFKEMFEDPRIKIVYHTAEQLKTRDDQDNLTQDPRTLFRYQTRNLIGSNRGAVPLELGQAPDSKYNTIGEVPGYYWWGAGFNLSANEKGCFSYRKDGKEYFFDLSIYDLEPENMSDEGENL